MEPVCLTARFVLARKSQGFYKETRSVWAWKRRFEPCFFKNDFIFNQFSSRTIFSASLASKIQFRNGSSRSALEVSKAIIFCSISTFCGMSGFLSSRNSSTSRVPSAKTLLIRQVWILSRQACLLVSRCRNVSDRLPLRPVLYTGRNFSFHSLASVRVLHFFSLPLQILPGACRSDRAMVFFVFVSAAVVVRFQAALFDVALGGDGIAA